MNKTISYMSYNRFLELLLRKRSGNISPDDQEELNGFLSDNPDYHEIKGMVDQLYDAPLKETTDIDETYLKNRWDSLKIRTGIAPANKPNSVRYLVALASIAALFMLVLLVFRKEHKDGMPAKEVVVASKEGSKTSMKLPDGSTVWLNAGSRISYDKDFGEIRREVILFGEAYFDVIHDPDHPFIVHAKDFDIKVLGTAFNVKAYTGEESETTLLRGSIELSIKNDESRKILLKPNEKLIFKNTDNIKVAARPITEEKTEILITGLQKPFNDSVAVETQWLHNCLAFRDDKLSEVAIQISRWYGVSVEVADDKLGEKEFSGIFKDESVEQVMEALKMAGGFNYSINKNKIIIIPNGQ